MLGALIRRHPRASRPDADDPPLNPEDIAPIDRPPGSPAAFLWSVMRRHFKGRMLLLLLFVVLGQGIDVFEPYVLRHLINGLAAATGQQAGSAPAGLSWLFGDPGLMGWFWILVSVWIGATVMYRFYQIVDIYTSPPLRAVVQKELFGYLLGHSPRYFQDNFAGKLGQKIKAAGQSCVALVELIMFEGVRNLVLLAAASAMLVALAPSYALTLAGWSVLYLGLSILLALRCIGLSAAMSDAVSTSTGKLIDVVTNSDLVRGFAKLGHERRFIGRWLDHERRCSSRLRWFLVLMRVYQLIGFTILLGGLVWLAMRDTLAGRMDIGGFSMVFGIGAMLAQNLWAMSNRMLEFFEKWGELSEALDLVTAPHEIADPPGAKPLAVTAGGIRIRDLRFAFPDGTPVFDGLDLEIRPGEKVGLVGHSGAGKSSLVKLIRRQMLPQGGSIEIDGQDVTRVAWDSLNEAIAEVPQQPGIFHRPVRDNIRYARPDADDEAVMRAARQAHAHDFIMRRPTGYDTVVGEQGIKLSGGERQRIAIARALLKDAPILVLDEATSALDSESEHLIQQALWRLMQGRTVIAIAHRLSTVTGLDRIVVLEGGRIAEQGSHAELLERGGAYARLWQRQVGGFLDAA